MSDDTGIEWTHVPGYKGRTWNPVRGCTKISPGCKHCYAEAFAERWRGVPGHPYEQGFDLRLVPEKLDEPLRKTKPHVYFVNSMSDLSHDDVPFEYIAAVFGVMAATPRHTFQVLTKRPARMLEFFDWLARQGGGPRTHVCWATLAAERETEAGDGGPFHTKYCAKPDGPWPLPNVWLGVSVEDRKYGVPRIDVLRKIPAAVRFLSVEPLLEDLGDLDLTGIDWVIIGGESGRKARPFAVEWALRIVKQCRAQGVPVFVKQPGNHPTAAGGLVPIRSKSDRAALARYGLDIREWPLVIQRTLALAM